MNPYQSVLNLTWNREEDGGDFDKEAKPPLTLNVFTPDLSNPQVIGSWPIPLAVL